MELTIVPHTKNNYPIAGFLIKSPFVKNWLNDIQFYNLSLSTIQVYPIPNVEPNTVWGCLVVFNDLNTKIQIVKHELCQAVCENLFIPERAIVYPHLSNTDIARLFSSGKHIMHPEFGLVELTPALDFQALISEPTINNITVTKPQPSIYIPGTIRSFQIQPLSSDDILKNLTEKIFPEYKKIQDKPLNTAEKVRLKFYKLIFAKKDGAASTTKFEKTQLGSKLNALFKKLFKTDVNWNKLEDDFNELEERNQKELNKLLNLFKTNPDEALKYAIPLDNNGVGRGQSKTKLDFTKRWFEFSLFANNNENTNAPAGILADDQYHQLHNQYCRTAEQLLRQNDYKKAAFVYMKLLKNYVKAAEVLEAGGYFQEAATIYLKHAGNKLKAAQCYEKGNMTADAIALFKELNNHEKVGDLYMTIYKRKEAITHYEKVVHEYKARNQYVKASLLYKTKMNDTLAAQALLLEGWETKRDAVNCLNTYFSNIADVDQLGKEIMNVYSTRVDKHNGESFLLVLQHEYRKKNRLQETIKEMAYEIVSNQIEGNPTIVSELKTFNPENRELLKDTIRFKSRKKNK